MAIDSLDDMETLFEGIPLGEVSTSMTINSPAAILLAFYVCVGDEQGVRARLRGRCRRTSSSTSRRGVHLPAGAVDAAGGGHDRVLRPRAAADAPDLDLRLPHQEAGSAAAQELAFTLADGFAYVDAAVERGLDVDEFAPRLSFFFNAHIDFFEEIAKYRAAGGSGRASSGTATGRRTRARC